ncbi:MAG: hypothetical protein PHG25_02745 [Candidatus Pacebacteria bacterium]|nr:hypothetical protein [Candidatus Paceibacterota bacterium]
MSKFISQEMHDRVSGYMLGLLGNTAPEQFLQDEISRYIPDLAGKSETDIVNFFAYQRAVYIDGIIPTVGRPIASLNPMFIDSANELFFGSGKGHEKDVRYTRASVKLNGFRLQMHRGPGITAAFSRQFTPYDPRMFPELTDTFKQLPCMIGDTELIPKLLKHNAALNALQDIRLSGPSSWPKPGTNRLDPEKLAAYLANPIIFDLAGAPHPHLELMLAFHGLFAIAHPKTWGEPRILQMQRMITLSKLPINYRIIDELLAELSAYMTERGLQATVAEKQIVNNPAELDAYVALKRQAGEEGVCVVQSRWNESGHSVLAPHGAKLKEYETVDMAVLGLYLNDTALGPVAENITGALMGLYDTSLKTYVPATRVNLDPDGVQIKTEGQSDRSTTLRLEIARIVHDRQGNVSADEYIHSLHEAYLMVGESMLPYLTKAYPSHAYDHSIADILENIPRGYDLWRLYQVFVKDRELYLAREMKHDTIVRKFIHSKVEFFKTIDVLDEARKKKFKNYFSIAGEVKERSNRLKKPQFLVSLATPLILEVKVFNLKWGTCSYVAGLHSWYPGESYCFSNNFAERVRHDKCHTTDYRTINVIARKHTPPRNKKRDKKT